MSVIRRRVIVGGFAIVFAGAGVLNAAVKRHDLAGINGEQAATSAVELGAGTLSSAWYCPGPLALGHRGEQSAVALTNLSSKPVHAALHVAANSGLTQNQALDIGPYHENVVALPRPKQPTYGAVTVVVNGPGVGVNEITTTHAGSTTAACTTHTSEGAFFGVGSTAGSSNMAISLYNPGATPAVANVAFIIGQTTSMPGAYTSVPIEPGQDVVFFAGHAIPQRRAFSVSVQTVSGRVAAGALDFKVVSAKLRSSLTIGAPVARPSWWFPPVFSAPSADHAYVLVNPTAHSEHAVIRLWGTSTNGATRVLVAPHASVQYFAPRARAAGVEAAAVSVSGPGSLIAEREVILGQPLSTPGHSGPVALPATVLPGFSVSPPAVAPSRQWLVAGGRSDRQVGEVLGLFNPHARPATVTVRQVFDGRISNVPGMRAITVAPFGVASVDMTKWIVNRSALVLVVGATQTVVAGATGFGISAEGFSSPGALPIR